MKQVFIIHGWTYNLDKWTGLQDELKKRGIEPVLLKVPGLTEPSDKVWDIDGYIGWLDGKIKDTPNPVVIGHSNGGRIALSYVQKYPGKLDQLILIDSAGVAHNETKAAIKLKTLKYLSKVGKGLSHVPPIKKAFYKIIGAQDYNNAPPNMKETMRNMLAADQKIDFSLVKLPVTIIWGREDSITPLDDGKKIHAGIAGSSLNIVDDARHAPFFNHPDRVAEIIVKALDN
ncbi:MAG TPA: alpha/beta hydrolase [Patescibacteria group bacterium]|nr:alpha/beta hydrolase [Patescibacteria group bacterium]